jgi:hypothetical protein
LITNALNPVSIKSPAVDAEWVAATAGKVLAAVEEHRSTVTGSVVTDSWADKQTGEVRYATRVLAQSIGVSLTFARVTGIERNTRTDA